MLSEFGEMAFEHPVEYAHAADIVRARCFFGSLVSAQEINVDQMTDLLEAVLIQAIKLGWQCGGITEDELESHVAAAILVSQCGPLLDPMFDVNTIQAVGEEVVNKDVPSPVCSDGVTPNPLFVDFVVIQLYAAVQRLNPQFELSRIVVSIAFASFTAWLTDAMRRNYYTSDQGLSIVERVQANISRVGARLH